MNLSSANPIIQAAKAIAIANVEQPDASSYAYPHTPTPRPHAYNSVATQQRSAKQIVDVQQLQLESANAVGFRTYPASTSLVQTSLLTSGQFKSQSHDPNDKSYPHHKPYPRHIRWFGRTCKYLAWSVVGAAIVGIVALITGQIGILNWFMMHYGNLLWRVVIILFFIGALIIVYSSLEDA